MGIPKGYTAAVIGGIPRKVNCELFLDMPWIYHAIQESALHFAGWVAGAGQSPPGPMDEAVAQF